MAYSLMQIYVPTKELAGMSVYLALYLIWISGRNKLQNNTAACNFGVQCHISASPQVMNLNYFMDLN